ncbi:MAG: TIGR04255 family protein [Cyanobacteria bacterium SZAS LIN-3]|nr:TIGR04255 family protein [Cyanobacteria bacterium SZAS LIN-3]
MGDNIDLRDTPKFNNPPLIETVLGVQFNPLPGFQLTHFGQFQTASDRKFAAIEQHPPLPRQIEERDDKGGDPQIIFQMFPNLMMANPRVWYRHPPRDNGEHLLQLQSDRLIVNWRRLPNAPSGHKYPSFSASRAEFAEYYSLFQDFVNSSAIGSLIPDQCEVCYVNQIDTTLFSSPGEAFSSVFDSPLPHKQPLHIEGDLENQNLNASYWCGKLKGRLFIDAAIMKSSETGKPVVTLRLTARGAPAGKSKEDVLDWLDLGHYYITNTFKDITSPAMHKVWEIEEKNKK